MAHHSTRLSSSASFVKTQPGTRYGRLVVIDYAPADKNGSFRYLCRCDCGREGIFRGSHLRRGEVTSCGSHRSEVLRANRHGVKHGMHGSPTYESWQAMLARCSYRKHPHYGHYGGRGIRVCRQWRKDFAAFVRDMGERPEGKTLDRIESNGDYEPSNCRWSTPKEQQNNLRSNRNLTFRGKTQCVSAWASEVGIKVSTIRERLKRGWAVERALTQGVLHGG